MDWLNGAAALVTILGFGFGLWQYRVARRIARTDRESIVEYRERLSNAQGGAELAWELANEVVQRSKEPSASTEDLRSGARSVRAALDVLRRQLAEQEQLLDAIGDAGKLAVRSDPPNAKKAKMRSTSPRTEQ